MKRLITLLLLTCLVGMGVASGASSESKDVGVDCVKPIDVTRAFQDLHNCKLLAGRTFDGNTALGFSNLDGANLSRATISGDGAGVLSTAVGADLRRADISGVAALANSDLTGANLSGARVSNVDGLFGANLTDANLARAIITSPNPLQNATFSNTTCPDRTNSDDNGGTCFGHLGALD